jgi:hypothetical protein
MEQYGDVLGSCGRSADTLFEWQHSGNDLGQLSDWSVEAVYDDQHWNEVQDHEDSQILDL